METTLVQPNGTATSRSRAGGSTTTTSQLELSRKIAALTDLTAQQLRTEWRRLYRSHPPRLSRDLLVRTIAYRMQELAYGGLSKATQRKTHSADQGIANEREALLLIPVHASGRGRGLCGNGAAGHTRSS